MRAEVLTVEDGNELVREGRSEAMDGEDGLDDVDDDDEDDTDELSASDGVIGVL